MVFPIQYQVEIIGSDLRKELLVDPGTNLLACIRKYVDNFYAPCGAAGTCGKCRVFITGSGHVTSCLYTIHKDIQVVLPERSEISVLTAQHAYNRKPGISIGRLSDLSPVPYGLAVDIGTTTMVFYLVHLGFGTVTDIYAVPNPQSVYGADVISRIQYGATTPSGVSHLQSKLTGAINEALNHFVKAHSLSETEIVKVAIAGNTVMQHQLMGVDALSIAHAPFTPAFTDTKRISPGILELPIHPEGEILIAPSLSGYVGADIIAGLASLEPEKTGKSYLYIDIGTNGEIVLVLPKKKYACATAAGPAFEGANISCGMMAETGAITSYGKRGYHVLGDTSPMGICGSGLIIVTYLLDAGTIQQDGTLKEDYIIYEGSNKSDAVILTQQDIREIQLAKSAIAAGINRLLAIAGVKTQDLNQVFIAGGFGNYMNLASTFRIGLLPDIPKEKCIQIGNSAGSGAILSVISESFISIMEQLKENIDYFELSNDPGFSLDFAMNMFFQ